MKYTNLPVIIGMAAICQPVQAQNDITWTNGHSYRVVFAVNPTWFQARDAASAMTLNGTNGYLATFVTRAEQEFVISHLGGGAYLNQLWLGGYQDSSASGYSEPYGGWRWITDEPWLGVAQDDPVLPRADAGFNNLYFDESAEGYAITWWLTGGVNDYSAFPSASYGYPARGFIVEFNVAAEPANVLTIAFLVDGRLELRWPVDPAWGLFTSSSLLAGSWDAVTNIPTVSGGGNVLLLPNTSSRAFFRLQRIP